MDRMGLPVEQLAGQLEIDETLDPLEELTGEMTRRLSELQIDPKRKRLATYLVNFAAFEAPERQRSFDRKLRASITSAATPARVVAVPRHAILSDQGGSYVYVVDRDNVARRRDLKLGATSPEWAAVESGLTAGERVVVDGLQRVRPDAPVQPEPVTIGDASSVETPRG